jgi:hypothetical protein
MKPSADKISKNPLEPISPHPAPWNRFLRALFPFGFYVYNKGNIAAEFLSGP